MAPSATGAYGRPLSLALSLLPDAYRERETISAPFSRKRERCGGEGLGMRAHSSAAGKKKNMLSLLSMTSPETQTPCLIAVIVAGTNEPSNSNTLADAFIEGMKGVPGIAFEKIRLKELSIDHFTLAHYSDANAEPDFRRVETLLKDAQGIVFASPIWNFSVPAHLKNLIDRMGAFALDSATHSQGQLKSKPCALLYTGGAPMIAWKALMYLTTLHVAEALKYYDGTIIYRHFEPRCTVSKGVFGLVVDKRPKTLEAMRRAGTSFANTTLYYAQTGSLPFKYKLIHRWFEFLYRVGNRIMYPISKLQ